jgi:hypothetical protein
MSRNRPPARLTKEAKHNQMVQQLEQLTMATRMNQLVIQQMSNVINSLKSEIGYATSMLNDFQYRMLAVQQLANLDANKLQEIADGLKIIDFNTEAAKKDVAEKAEIVDKIESVDDVVIITSSTPGQDAGILRSRIKVVEMNQPELADALIGKTIGDKVEAKLNNMTHIIEILGIRRLPKVEEQVEVEVKAE